MLLSASYSELSWGGVWHLFIFIPHLYNHELAHEKILDPRITHEKRSWIHKIPTGEKFRPTKYPREKVSDPRNTHEKKFRIHQIPRRKTFGPTMT